MLRKQYFFRPSPRGLLAWDIDRLVELSRDFTPRAVPLSEIAELDAPWPVDGTQPTWRAIIDHIRLIDEADLSYPIILAANSEVMDGRHRIAKAAREGRTTIMAVRFLVDPEPDFVGRQPDDLPY